MDFTVFTTAGGFRDFSGESTFNVGEQNGVLYVFDGGTGQVLVYGASAWASVQEKKLVDEPVVTGGRRRLVDDTADGTDEQVPAELLSADQLDAAFSTEPAEPRLESLPRFERGPVFQPKHA